VEILSKVGVPGWDLDLCSRRERARRCRARHAGESWRKVEGVEAASAYATPTQLWVCSKLGWSWVRLSWQVGICRTVACQELWAHPFPCPPCGGAFWGRCGPMARALGRGWARTVTLRLARLPAGLLRLQPGEVLAGPGAGLPKMGSCLRARITSTRMLLAPRHARSGAREVRHRLG
jgi:hypothetical protein